MTEEASDRESWPAGAERVVRRFRRRDRTLIAEFRGPADGETYLLVHGLGMGRGYWGEFADALAERGRVVAIDLPGFGDAPEPEQALSIPESGDLLAEFLSVERLHDPVLVGHSMGSQLVAEAAARHPESATRIVLLSPTIDPSARSAAAQLARMVVDVAWANPLVAVHGVLNYVKAGPRWFLAKLRTMLDHRVELALPRIAARALVVRGDRDRVVPRAWAERATALLPHGELVELPDRGHETMIGDGREVAELVERFAAGERVGRAIPLAATSGAASGSDPVEGRTTVRWRAMSWMLDYLYASWRQLASIGRRPPRRWRAGEPSKPTVLLLPGVYESWAFLAPFGDALNREGYRVQVIPGLGANLRGIDETAAAILAALDRARTPSAGRVVVGHSKGGLIGKRMLLDPRAAHLGLLGLVAVAAPFGGSTRARWLRARSIRAFLPDDPEIVALNEPDAGGVDSVIVSVFGPYDPHIPSGSALEGARNVRVPTAGHFRVLAGAPTRRAVLGALAELAAAGA